MSHTSHPPLFDAKRCWIQTYLTKWFNLALHDELKFTELTASDVWRLDPLLKASLMNIPQGSCTVTRCNKGHLTVPFTVADSENKIIKNSEILDINKNYTVITFYLLLQFFIYAKWQWTHLRQCAAIQKCRTSYCDGFAQALLDNSQWANRLPR
jgi:hypothetical protein